MYLGGEGDVLCVRILGGAEGHWECDGSDWLNSFAVEAVEWLLGKGFQLGYHYR
jgi:hypothetical protein